VALTVALYAVPITAGDNGDVVVMLNAGGAWTVIVTVRLADTFAASVTWKVIVLLAVPVGVPVIAPVLVFRLKPAGRFPEVMAHV
jgi:hypothetical protein